MKRKGRTTRCCELSPPELRELAARAMTPGERLAESSPAACRPLPPWTGTLNAALRATASEEPTADGRILDAHQPVPFEEVLLPFVRVARRELGATAGALGRWLSDGARADLERSFLQFLSYLAAPTLELEFTAFRAAGRSTLARLVEKAREKPARDEYRRFVAGLLAGGLQDLMREYAALARLLATVTDLWVASAAELLSRLHADAGELRRTFRVAGELGGVEAVECHVGDRHRGGRSVWILTFACGLKVAYKPRSLGIDRAFFGLLAWLNEHDPPAPFLLLRVIDRGGYGWMEFAEAFPCRDPEETGRYYRRAGMLLCLLYLLEATDVHAGNVVACGEQPVLIDAETLLQHRTREAEEPASGPAARDLARRRIWHSVLRTGLLPRWQLDGGQGGYDLSALGGVGDQTTPGRVPRWRHVNTDAMALGAEHVPLPRQANAPGTDPDALPGAEHSAELSAGFGAMYRFLIAHREALASPGGPLADFACRRVRFLLRPTWLYGVFLRRTLNPQRLRDGADRSRELEPLSKAFSSGPAAARLGPLLSREKEALERFDVPVFDAVPGRDVLVLEDGGTVAGLLAGASFERMMARLRRLDEADLEAQIGFIRGSMAARIAVGEHGPAVTAGPKAAADSEAVLSPEALVASSVALAGELVERAVQAPDGSVTWIGPQFVPAAGRFQLEPLGTGLYDGVGGVALFLAALARVTGSGEYRDLAHSALRALGQQWRDGAAAGDRIGGGRGWGSIVYVLTRVGGLLGESAWLEEAQRVVAAIRPEEIRGDRRFDVLSGAAGALLGLLVFSAASGTGEADDKAVLCGRHLLAHRVAAPGGHRVWASGNRHPLTGFSHGAAGIGYALLRLYLVTGEVGFRAAAEEAFAWERRVFDRAAGNWPDFRPAASGDRRRCGCAWCHGAPGIGLARLGGLEALATEPVRGDLEAAIAATTRQPRTALDQLCCGNLGRAELLFSAGRNLSRPQLRTAALELATQVVARAGSRSGYGYTPPGAFNPGFFQGSAGIGYELLRLGHPELVPSVLLWE